MSAWIVFFGFSWGRLMVSYTLCWGVRGAPWTTPVAELAWEHIYQHAQPGKLFGVEFEDEFSDCPELREDEQLTP
jgi:hypothetical protein